MQGLIGAGERPVEARRLVASQDHCPLMRLAGLASDIMIAAMTGIQPDDLSRDDKPDAQFDVGAIFHSLAQVGIPPEQVRAMRYADFVNLMRAATGKSVQPPSEEEFDEMIRNWEARQA